MQVEDELEILSSCAMMESYPYEILVDVRVLPQHRNQIGAQPRRLVLHDVLDNIVALFDLLHAEQFIAEVDLELQKLISNHRLKLDCSFRIIFLDARHLSEQIIEIHSFDLIGVVIDNMVKMSD